MDNPFKDNNKQDKLSAQESKGNTLSSSRSAVGSALPAPSQDQEPNPKATIDFSNTSLGAYKQHDGQPTPLTQKAYDELLPGYEKGGTWNSTPQGRLAIRALTRGVMGVAAFVVAGKVGKQWLHDYDATLPLLKQNNPLKFISKGLDTIIGKPIKAVVKAVTGSEEAALNAVHFRPTRFTHLTKDGAIGRPYGAEVSAVTFDFFSMSVADAFGRDLVNWFDPHIKKTWKDEKGNIDPDAAIKSAAKAAWRYLSYNGGEDWFTGLTYVYTLRGIKNMINKASPGFKYDSHHTRNGGSFKLNNQNQVIGNYVKEGALDLQLRFMAYNGAIPLPFGTIHYREVYDYIGNRLAGTPDSLYGGPQGEEARKHKGPLGLAQDAAKWSLRDMVKSTIYMLPTVPIFWAFRTFASKDAKFIHPERGIVPANEVAGIGKNFDPYAKTYGMFDTAFNPIGKLHRAGKEALTPVANWADHHLPFINELKKATGVTKTKEFTDEWVRGIGYLPYMYLKSENSGGGFNFGNGFKFGGWDNGKMDLAAERMIDGAFNLNWKEFKAGAQEVGYSTLHKPFPNAKREAEAQFRLDFEKSTGDEIFDVPSAKIDKIPPVQDKKPDWRERVIGKERGDDAASLEDMYKRKLDVITERKPELKAEREEMRKMLAKLDPPTNSVN